nr:hypothetical protein [Thermoanaerobaculia bacterium]
MLSRTLPRLFKGRLLAFLLVVAAFVPAAPASAATARFFGQVFQVDPAQAEDSNISAGDLSGSPLAFVRIQLYNRADGALLATGDAGINGQFTLRFTPPTGPAPNVEARVFRVVDGGSTLLPAARAGINFFDHLGLFTPAALKVAGEDRSTVGESGLSSIPGIGLLFTRVGKVEIPFIAQNTALASRPVAGLADLNADPVRAAELGISFEKAPFAGLLQVFGDFGTPSASCNCPPGPPCVPSIDYYRATLRKINEAAPGLVYDSEMPFLDPLHKIRTQVTTLPTLSLVNSTVSIGPLDGGLDDPATPALEEAPISGLYWVNRNEVGGVTSTFYSYPDLRL